MEDVISNVIEIVITEDGEVVWINYTEKCLFRAHGVNQIIIDNRWGK